MTPYQQGFITKCAEYGITDPSVVEYLYKMAKPVRTVRWSAPGRPRPPREVVPVMGPNKGKSLGAESGAGRDAAYRADRAAAARAANMPVYERAKPQPATVHTVPPPAAATPATTETLPPPPATTTPATTETQPPPPPAPPPPSTPVASGGEVFSRYSRPPLDLRRQGNVNRYRGRRQSITTPGFGSYAAV